MDYNEEDYNAYLPKRSNEIYKEIESFEEYELTQCVAYEMAIRGEDENFSIIPLWELEKNNTFLLSDIDLYDVCKLSDKVIKFYPTYLKDTETVAYQLFKEKTNKMSDFQCHDEEILKTMFQQAKTYWINRFANNLDYFIQNFLLNENKEFIPQQLSTWLEDIFIDKTHLIEIIKNSSKVLHYQPIKYKRPKIVSNLTKDVRININLALPLTELMAQITKIKNCYNKYDNILKAPIELLGEELQKATPTKNYPKKPKAEKMADMFFVYDYVKARQNKIKELNADEELRYKKELQRISNDKDLSTREKKIQRTSSKVEHLELLIATTQLDIFKEDELLKQLNVSSGNVEKMYHAIKPYIDDCKYKELITGVSTL